MTTTVRKEPFFYETSRFVSDNDKEWFDAELLQNVKKELGADYEEMAKVDPLLVSSFKACWPRTTSTSLTS